jgi:hypothetical protein
VVIQMTATTIPIIAATTLLADAAVRDDAVGLAASPDPDL